MNCQLYYHLQQEAYLANIRQECAEQERKQREMIKHANDCPFCNGYVEDPLIVDLFGGPVVITKDERRENL